MGCLDALGPGGAGFAGVWFVASGMDGSFEECGRCPAGSWRKFDGLWDMPVLSGKAGEGAAGEASPGGD